MQRNQKDPMPVCTRDVYNANFENTLDSVYPMLFLLFLFLSIANEINDEAASCE